MSKGILLCSPYLFATTVTTAHPNLLCLPGSGRFEVSFDPRFSSGKNNSLHLGCVQPLLSPCLWSCLSAVHFSLLLFLLLQVLLTVPSQLPLPPPQAFGSAKPNREAELLITLIKYSPSVPWAGDTGSGRRACWLWRGLLSFAQCPTGSFPQSALQQCAMTPGLRAARWYETNTPIMLIGSEPRWKSLLQIALSFGDSFSSGPITD